MNNFFWKEKCCGKQSLLAIDQDKVNGMNSVNSIKLFREYLDPTQVDPLKSNGERKKNAKTVPANYWTSKLIVYHPIIRNYNYELKDLI